MQSQEALKIIHGIPVQPGKVTHFNGMTNQMHTTAYIAREDCESHWTYGEITELPLRSETTTVDEFIRIVRVDLGPDAVVELDQELILELECPVCLNVEPTLKPISEISFEEAHCPTCGTFRETKMTHTLTGEETFTHHTLANLGMPPLHILRAHNAKEYKFYELTGDLPNALHFSHFERSEDHPQIQLRNRIQLGDEIHLEYNPERPAQGRITIQD
jgi:adenylyltransferase/sulfurtransferase